MNSPSAISETIEMQMKDSDWRALVRALRRRNVIPMIGPDLIRIRVGDQDVPYDHLVARNLAERRNITDDDMKPMGISLADASLNDVVSASIRKCQDPCRDELHDEVVQIMSSIPVQPSEALTKLAEITDIGLFLTSTSDSLFEGELRRIRGSSVRACVFRRQDPIKQDIPENARIDIEQRCLYYLFGKAEQDTTDFAICEEELLRFFLKIQDSKYRPKNLFDELRENNLLLLGVNFSDWLARLFLWLAKDKDKQTVEAANSLKEYLADPKAGQDRPLVLFLQHFSRSTIIVPKQPADFVDELHRRWSQPTSLLGDNEMNEIKPSADMARGAVFLSYARQDRDAVRTLFSALRQSGIPAWYDDGIQGGDDFEKKLANNINNCSAFVPLLSTTALERPEGYFRKEWKKAVDRDERYFGRERGSIIPIVIDRDDKILREPDTQRGLPERFMQMHMYHCPLGTPPQELVNSLRSYLDNRT